MIEPKYTPGDRVIVTVADDMFTGHSATIRSWKRRNKPRRILYILDIDGTPMKWGAGPYTEDELTKEPNRVNITQITVSYGETQSLPEYSNVKPSITITAAIEEGEDATAVEVALWAHAKQQVHEQIDLALESNDKAAKYSTEPRFQVLKTYQGYTARGRIEQPKIVVILPDVMQLEKRLDERLGGVSYRETKKLRYAHALRIATEYAHDQQSELLDCADGDISRLEAALPPLPEPESTVQQDTDLGGPGGADLYAAAFEDDDDDLDEDEE